MRSKAGRQDDDWIPAARVAARSGEKSRSIAKRIGVSIFRVNCAITPGYREITVARIKAWRERMPHNPREYSGTKSGVKLVAAIPRADAFIKTMYLGGGTSQAGRYVQVSLPRLKFMEREIDA